MTGSSAVEEQAKRRRRRTAGWTTLVGLAMLAGTAAVALSWRAELPDPIASHWGSDDTPNGFTTLDATLRVMLIGGTALVLLFGAITLWLGQSAWTRRIGAAGSIWSALFLATLIGGSLAQQRGLADARNASGIGGVLLVAVIVSVVAALIVAVVVPGDPPQPTTAPVDRDAPRVPLRPDERPTWRGATRSAPALLVGLVAVALVVGLAALTGVWPLLAVAVVLALIVGPLSAVTVRVDEAGVTIRSPLGWPRTRVPLNEIVRADATEVRPMRDFGGWGWRVGRSGRVGIALRAGEALLVERTGARSLVVTVDDAAAAAGLVNALADRVRNR